jgi:Zn-dependent protease with chaperone function
MKIKLNKYYKIAAAILCVLSIPLIAMQFTNEVDWSRMDFVVAGLLLFIAATIGDFVRRKLSNFKYKYLVYLILIMTFLLLWAEMAVGLFNSPISGS